MGGSSARLMQSAALAYRRIGQGPKVLLVTSKRTGRWVLPKGGIDAGLTAYDSAAREAHEEAGVVGQVLRRCIGVYGYRKARQKGNAYCLVRVYPLKVATVHHDWPERRWRRRRWMDFDEAAARVKEKDLRKILLSFHAALSVGGRSC